MQRSNRSKVLRRPHKYYEMPVFCPFCGGSMEVFWISALARHYTRQFITYRCGRIWFNPRLGIPDDKPWIADLPALHLPGKDDN